MGQCSFGLLIDRFVRFIEVGTAFGMTENDMGDADVDEHGR